MGCCLSYRLSTNPDLIDYQQNKKDHRPSPPQSIEGDTKANVIVKAQVYTCHTVCGLGSMLIQMLSY